MPWGAVTAIGSFLGTTAGAASAVGAAGAIGSALISSSANKSAAKTAAAADTAAAAAKNEAIDKQIAAVKQGIAEGDVLYNQTKTETQPGVSYLRNVIAAPTSLTPDQLQAREDLLRRVTNSAQVAGSALRGSGRSFVDAMRAVEADFTNTALAQNRARADEVARQFSTPYFNASGQEAQAHASQGTQVGGALAAQGINTGAALTDAATTQANASLANAGLTGNAIGQIGSTIADALKKQSTTSNYAKATYDPETGNYTPGPGGF